MTDAVACFVSGPVIKSLENNKKVTPAIIRRAADILHELDGALPPASRDRVFGHLISRAIKAKHLWQYFKIICNKLNLEPRVIPPAAKAIGNATLEDFEIIKHQHFTNPFPDSHAFAEALITHCAKK